MLSFKDMLKGFKKKPKKDPVNNDAATADEGSGTIQQLENSNAADDDEEIELGAFPASVHKLWKLTSRGWSSSHNSSSSKPIGSKIATCLTVVDTLPHEGDVLSL
jgi:hypothetical protein